MYHTPAAASLIHGAAHHNPDVTHLGTHPGTHPEVLCPSKHNSETPWEAEQY